MYSCRMCTKWDDEPELRIAELECCNDLLNRDQFFPGNAERIGQVRKAITI
jgi:hypothetical protein